jgi:hypothetical protein
MSVKTNGAELKAFFDDQEYWGATGWYEETEFFINKSDEPEYEIDPNEVAPSDMILMVGGIYYPSSTATTEEGVSLESFFRRWRKKQNTTTLVVECSKDHEDAVKTAIKMAGGKIL